MVKHTLSLVSALVTLSCSCSVFAAAVERDSVASRTVAATCATIPSSVSFPAESALPDPFQPLTGDRVSTLDEWACRQSELSQLLQRDELGTLPPKPNMTATFSGTTLTINVSVNGKSISFAPTISFPTGSGPFPAMIAYDGGSIPRATGVAWISFTIDDIAAQNSASSRGQGKFYTLYGSDHDAGAMMAWAWGVQRIIDALETLPAAKIDTTRIGVTGCSRNGKGALVAGAFDSRIALTIPQESGSGGAASWRLSNYQQSLGQNVQTATEIVQENVWFSPNFDSWVNQVNNLPFDHHSLAALVAPRGLFVIENSDYEWLGALSTYGCQEATKLVYQAVSAPDSFGYSQIGGHSHCAFPSSQQADLTAFINKFLLKQSSNTTGIFKTDQTYSWPEDEFIPWTPPTLQ